MLTTNLCKQYVLAKLVGNFVTKRYVDLCTYIFTVSATSGCREDIRHMRLV